MKFLLLSLLARLALSVTFNTHASCTSYEAACTGNAGDGGVTCLGQDAQVVGALAVQGIDATTLSTWDVTTMGHAVRWAYYINHAGYGVMAPHIDYEPILRCTAEANGISWGQVTACFAETASCMDDPTCVAAWDQAANLTKASVGMTFTYVKNGFQAIGDVAFTFVQDGTDPLNPVAMIPDQLGVLNGFVDMANHGKASAMMACMMNDWAGVDVGTAYPLDYCFDVVNQCDQDADCKAASADFASCASDDYDITIGLALPLWPTLYGVMPTTASHDDWCNAGTCAAQTGNALFLSMSTCAMQQAGFSYQKCYDDMMNKVKMLAILVGGVSFVVGVLVFTGIWCVACRPSKSDASAV